VTDAQLEAAGWKVRPLPGFVASLGPLWSRREGSGFAYALRAETRHANALGMIHGGLLSTLVDHAMLVNAWEACARHACVTVSLEVRFVAAAAPGDLLIARGVVEEVGKVLVFASGTVDVVRAGTAGHDAEAMPAGVVAVRASAVIRRH
jgi:uncharacterized protein (TIGR00369 family)